MAGMARREEGQAAWYPDAKRLRTDDDEGGVFRWKKKEVEEQRAGLSRHDVERRDAAPVSYTHLTLPTILLV